MNTTQHISYLHLLIILFISTPMIEAKNKSNKKKSTPSEKTTKEKETTQKSKASGLISFLFPIPAIIYNAGYNETTNSTTAKSGSFFEIYSPSDTHTTTFKDVAGLHGAKEDMQDIIEFIKDSDKFTKMGAKIPKGLLMTGGPGNGKTLLARAAAGEMNCTFISVNGSDFSSEWAGVATSRVQELFQVAHKNAPCVIF